MHFLEEIVLFVTSHLGFDCELAVDVTSNVCMNIANLNVTAYVTAYVTVYVTGPPSCSLVVHQLCLGLCLVPLSTSHLHYYLLYRKRR